VTLAAEVAAIVRQARIERREVLHETEALTIAAAAGVAIPAQVVVPAADATAIGSADLRAFAGDRIVVKAQVAGLTHKTDIGGVEITRREAAAISETIAAMAARLPEAEAFIVADYVEHDPGPAGEMLLGMRWTDEFGPVVTFGFGGVATEALAALSPDRAVAALSPSLDEAEVRRVLERMAITPMITASVRGRPPSIEFDDLADLVARFLDLAEHAMPQELAEFEINPLVVGASGPIALDAVARLGPLAAANTRSPIAASAVHKMLRPNSIGIIGVSAGMNLGRIILRNVLAAGFPAEAVTVVKEGTEEIDGVRCVGDVNALGGVDLLVVSVGAAAVPELLETVAAAEAADTVILIPGGIGELPGSEDHAARISAMLDGRAAGSGPFVNGGNCMGIRSVPGSYDTTFIPEHKMTASPRRGEHPVAVVSQSGAFVLARLDRLRWLDPKYVVTVGNQIDLTVGDYLDHFADDPEIQIAACYVEGFRPVDGRRWMEAAARLTARGGSVVLLRAGRTEAGARSAATHTAALAGDPLVTRSLAEAVGVLVADSLDEFEDLLRLAVLLRERPIAGLRLGVVSNAGFECVAAADALGPFEEAKLQPGSEQMIGDLLASRRLDGVVGARNPLDLTPSMDDEGFVAAAAVVLADPGVDVGVVGCVPFTPSLNTLPAAAGHDEDLTRAGSLPRRLIDLWRSSDKAWVAIVDGGASYDPMAVLLEGAGVPTFRAADRALRVLGQYAINNRSLRSTATRSATRLRDSRA
jgi:acyl-CoA synthetase (NDP forming)